LQKSCEIYLFYGDQTKTATDYFTNLQIRFKILEREFKAHCNGNVNNFKEFRHLLCFVSDSRSDPNQFQGLMFQLDSTEEVLKFLERDEMHKATLFECIGGSLKIYEEERCSFFLKQKESRDDGQTLVDIFAESCHFSFFHLLNNF
jgi:hypothetical protein